MTASYSLHFGLVADDWLAGPPQIDGHSDATVEHEMTLGFPLRGRLRAFVSGSWETWGPDDQDEEPQSLHVVVEVESVPDAALVEQIKDALYVLGGRDYLGNGGTDANFRVLDYALLTPWDDWSVKTYAYLGEYRYQVVR